MKNEDRAKMPCYIGKKECGCVVFAMVDTPEFKKETAKEIAKCIRQGLIVERVTVQYVRDLEEFGCKHETKNNQGELDDGTIPGPAH